jgi:putative membrane protein
VAPPIAFGPIVLAAGPSPSLRDVLLGYSLAPVPVLAVAATITAYLLGVRRLAQRGRRWPRARTTAFLAGCGVVALALVSGIAEYDQSTFSVHVVQHLLLGMLGPLLLALGAPVTLALQAGSRATQTRLLRILHSPPVKALTNPFVAWLLFSATLFVLYFTGLYSLSLRHFYVHDLVHLHFLVVGMLFFWPVVGLDPRVWRVHHGARLLYVMLALPVHAFLGIALLSGQTPLFEAHTLADQHAGGGILWAFGDLLTLATVGVVLSQWMSHEEREAAREDRLVDAARAARLQP